MYGTAPGVRFATPPRPVECLKRYIIIILSDLEPNSGNPNCNVHSRGMLVGGTFVLFHFQDAPLNGIARVEVPYAPAPCAMHGVAGSRARLRVGASDVA